MDEVSDLVGDHILKGDFWGLDEAPVDTDDIVLAARAPGVLGVGQAGAFDGHSEAFGVSSGEGLEVGPGTLSEPLLQLAPHGSTSLTFG